MTEKQFKELLEAQKEIMGLLAILVKRDMLQSSLIREMAMVGLRPKRIAELLNTTPNTINVSLSQFKRSTKSLKNIK
ncbi:MAG: hypothetical protein WC619_04855 [Patescibacteria group bacterium]